MKAALILQRFDIRRGGAERSTSEMAGALARRGVQVTVAAPIVCGDNAPDAPYACAELPLPPSGAYLSRLNQAAETLRREGGYDIIHSMVPLPAADVYQPRGGSARHSGLRHAASFGRWAWCKRLTGVFNRGRTQYIKAEQNLCAAAAGPVIAAVSDYVRRQYIEDYHADEHRLRVVLNGVDVERFRSEKARQEGRHLRQLYDRRGDKTILLFAAENLRLKGLDPLLAALEHVPSQHHFCVLVVSGANYGAYWPRARRLGERVVFMGSTAKMPAMMNLADAVVLPTWNDACSRVVMEALAAGKPALTTRCNGAAEFIEHGQTGYIIDSPGNITALADGLTQLCDPVRRRAWAEAVEGRRLYEQVSMDRHAGELLTLYREIIDKRR